VDCIQCGTAFEATEGSCPQCGWNADVLFDPSILRPGELIRGRYEIDRVLGMGRLGAVLGAGDLETDSAVVIKFIHHGLVPDEGAGRRFMKGMRGLMRLEHPIMTRVLDVNCEGQRYFVVSEHLEGVPLRDLMESRRAQRRGFTIREVYPIIRQVTAFLIESGIGPHGALCPENVWILPQNLKVLDSGLAANLPAGAVGHRLASVGRLRGYVAPEMKRGAAPTQRSDVYSLGVLLGEMVTQTIFDGRAEMFHEVDPDMPVEVDAVLRRALLVDPRGRFADAAELLEDIARLADAPPPMLKRHQEVAGEIGEPQDRAPEAPPPKRVRRAPPPRRAMDFGIVASPDATVQVSMDDVIKAHLDHVERRFAAEDSGVKAVPPPAPPARASAPPPPPPRRVSAPPPPPPRRDEPVEQPQPAFVSNFQPASVPRVTIAPKRPEPRKSVPPPPARVVAPPPRKIRADEPILFDEDEPTSVGRASAARGSERPRREVTQEIDMEEIEAVSPASSRREVTQEVDASMIQFEDRSSMREALSKLERQAADAERASTEELFRHAQRLDGVDPRFVRAAHKLEAEKRGSRSKAAAEALREKADRLDGIDPRLLRAAARLEEARVNDVPVTGVHEVEKLRAEDQGGGDDWRERMEAMKEDSVISFIAPPVVARSSEVSGFPRTQQRAQRNRAPAPPPAPPPQRDRGHKREPHNHPRALYDDSGETDDESQPTILVRPSSLPGSPAQAVENRRLRYAEMMMPLLVGLLLAGMIILLGVAAAGS